MTSVSFPQTGRIAGLDYGTVRVGVAISDPDRVIASPWETYTRAGQEADAAYFRQLVQDERIVGFVVGLPVHSSGDESHKSLEARAFGTWLATVTERPVCYYDERYSSVEADRVLASAQRTRRQRKRLRDQLAAQVILASFLESGGAAPAAPLDG